jgi:hypothetical protein
MQIEILEDEGEYRRLYNAVFDTPISHIPDVIFICRHSDGRTVGFVAGFWNSDDSFYIQYSGVLPEFQGDGYTRYFDSMLRKDITYDCIIKNTNPKALIVALKVGFIPIGMTQKDNKLYIMVQRGPV